MIQNMTQERAVVVSSRNQENVDEAVAKLRARGITCTGVVCHVGLKGHRDRLIDTALQVHILSLYMPVDVLLSHSYFLFCFQRVSFWTFQGHTYMYLMQFNAS
jgi:hypothetical protein